MFFSCAGLKCQQASNLDFYPPNSIVEECDPPHNAYCATATIRNGEIPGYTCGDDKFCKTKSCSNSVHCTKPGTFERDYAGLNNVKYTVTCCDTDLCNVGSSAKTLYRASFSCIFNMSVFFFLLRYFVNLFLCIYQPTQLKST